MKRGAALAMLLVLLAGAGLWGCGGLKMAVLIGTSVPNPPTEPVGIYIEQFPVTSKAAVLERRAVVGGGTTAAGGSSINALADVGAAVMEISRPCRIEDITGAVLRELRRDSVRVFVDLENVSDLGEVRLIENPFRLVATGSEEAQVGISGTALIRSQRVSKEFSQMTTGVDIGLEITDLATGQRTETNTLRARIRMLFNSKELEEAMAIAVVTQLNQKTLF